MLPFPVTRTSMVYNYPFTLLIGIRHELRVVKGPKRAMKL
jgi:hypothetical protein